MMDNSFGNIIQIGDILVSTDVVTEYFACDYEKCHGQCCVVGDSGAPLLEGEDEELERAYDAFSPYMTPAGRAAVDSVGFFEIDREGDMVTPVVHSPHRVPGLDYIPGTHSLAGLPGLEDCAFISYEPSGAGGEPGDAPGAASGAVPGAAPGAIPGMSEPGAAPGAASGAVPGMSEPVAAPVAGLGAVPGMSSAANPSPAASTPSASSASRAAARPSTTTAGTSAPTPSPKAAAKASASSNSSANPSPKPSAPTSGTPSAPPPTTSPASPSHAHPPPAGARTPSEPASHASPAGGALQLRARAKRKPSFQDPPRTFLVVEGR